MNRSVVLGECWARDGLQNETLIVPTSVKVEMISRFVDAGFKKIEATSFSHPKYLPQFADAEEVLRKIPRGPKAPGVSYRAICTTPKAIERAVKSKDEGYGVDEIAMVLSSTDAHNRANVNAPQEEYQRTLEGMIRDALKTEHEVFGWVLTSFGCPISGDVPVENVLKLGRWWKSQGARYIGFGDTTGSANPRQAREFYERVLSEGFSADEVVVHFHDTRGWGVANNLAALQAGMRLFDGSIGGIGGQPKTGAANYHPGYTGNTSSEDLVSMFEEMGIATGIDITKLLDAGRRAEAILERQLNSRFLHAGPVKH